MKIIIGLISIVITGSLVFSPSLKLINGTWVLQKENYLYYPYVLRLKMDEGYIKATVDIPTQHLFDMALNSIVLKADIIFINMDKNKSVQIKAIVRDKEIYGELVTGVRKIK